MVFFRGVGMWATWTNCVLASGICLVGMITASGCFHFEDECERARDCPSGGTGGMSTSSTSSSGTGGTPVNCVPSESKGPVAESCGVFVSSSLGADDKAADRGTKAKPFKSITAALKKAEVARVYACAESFSESVTISAAVEFYGALDCKKSWVYVGATIKTKLTADADTVPLTLTGDAKVEDFTIAAADAKLDGGSSIAVIADHAAASFVRCDLAAGAGKAGLDGATPTDPVEPTDSNDAAVKGNDGKNACADPAMLFGGAAKENALCPLASGGPLGGSGGQGAVTNGSNGDASPATLATALGGKGEPTADPLWSCAIGAGLGGTNGPAGTDGGGATGVSSLGALDKSGYTGTSGQPGGPAAPGQGGGGGGGAKGKSVPACAGASGGGGGAGGCGGKGGLGGNAGGASIALVSLGGMVDLKLVTLKVSKGGQGGGGGDGQGGGVGGNGGNGGKGDAAAPSTLKACNGGAGGQGGTGGKGGGGRGGHAIGLAYTGAAMPSTKGVTFTPGTAGKGGAGSADMKHDGDPGVQADTQAFP